MAGSALWSADDFQLVPADGEPARGCRTQLQLGRGWEDRLSLMVLSNYQVSQEMMVRPQFCKCRQKETCRQNFVNLSAHWCYSQATSMLQSKMISVSHQHTQENLEKLCTFWLQPGSSSPGCTYPGGLKVWGREVKGRSWRKQSSTDSPSLQAAAPETAWNLGEKSRRCPLVELLPSVSQLHLPQTGKQQHYNKFQGISGISYFKGWRSCLG